jgi:hypothetical protein
MRDPKTDAANVSDVAPNVKGFLEREYFVTKLDEVFCPTDPSKSCVECQHIFEYSVRILEEIGMDSLEIDGVIADLNSRGCCCDCAILKNVVAEGRLKGEYWKAKASELSAG